MYTVGLHLTSRKGALSDGLPRNGLSSLEKRLAGAGTDGLVHAGTGRNRSGRESQSEAI
jgi:hypothetical protein